MNTIFPPARLFQKCTCLGYSICIKSQGQRTFALPRWLAKLSLRCRFRGCGCLRCRIFAEPVTWHSYNGYCCFCGDVSAWTSPDLTEVDWTSTLFLSLDFLRRVSLTSQCAAIWRVDVCLMHLIKVALPELISDENFMVGDSLLCDGASKPFLRSPRKYWTRNYWSCSPIVNSRSLLPTIRGTKILGNNLPFLRNVGGNLSA